MDELNQKNSLNSNTAPTKKTKAPKKSARPVNANGVIENGNGSGPESVPTRQGRNSEKTVPNESDSPLYRNSSLKGQTSNASNNALDLSRISAQSSLSTGSNMINSTKFQQVELTNVTDEEEDDYVNQKQKTSLIKDTKLSDHDQFITSVTTLNDNDVIEIHEFSLDDIDAYLDIYFEALNHRLTRYIGEDSEIHKFRAGMKSRIGSDTNSREYHNVLLGKINGEVVAAVTLSFPGEATTVSNNDILPSANSCMASLQRRLVRNANYVPKNISECYIEMIGVKSAFRNHGIGAALLECVEHFAQQAGALQLTVHTNGDHLRNYFERFGFLIDRSDNSALWKWIVERQGINKMSKTIASNNESTEDQIDNNESYINESMVESEAE